MNDATEIALAVADDHPAIALAIEGAALLESPGESPIRLVGRAHRVGVAL